MSKMSKNKYIYWHGMLTTQNIERVCNLLFQLLDGRTYTFVDSNDLFPDKQEVYTSQRLSSGEAIFIRHHDEDGSASFHVCDTYGVWGCETNLGEDVYDPTFKNPYFVFEGGRVTITHRAPEGYLLRWVITVE